MIRSALAWAPACCALCVMAIAISTAQGAITDDLYAYWDMDGNLEDTVDANHNGTLLSASSATPTFATGKFGQAIDLDRADTQSVQVGTAANEADFDFVDGTISISAWFTVENFDTAWQALIAKGEGTSWRAARERSTGVMSYAGGSGDIPADGSGPVVNDPINTWHHLAAISENGVSTRLWVDGALVGTGAAPAITKNSTNQMEIGGNPDNTGSRSWDGNIDDVAIWTRAITEAEINTIWNNGTGSAIGDIGTIFGPTDFNRDGTVNVADYDILATNFLAAGDGTQGDANNDGFVDLDDFVKWRADFENPAIPSTLAQGVVPEPSSLFLGMLLMGMLAVTRTARR